LPVVEVLSVDHSRRVVPFDFQVMAEAPGHSLRDFDDDDDAILPLLNALGRAIARLHRVGLEGFGWIDTSPMAKPEADPSRVIGIFGSWGDYVMLRLDEHLSICVTIGAISPNEADRIGQLIGDSAGLLQAHEPRLLHGDLGNHNVFVSGGQVSALIDWEDCLAGDPAFDVAFWATFHPDRRLAAIIGGYGSESELPDDFIRRFWLYYLRIALSKTVLRHRFGDVDRPGRAPAATRIRKALDRLEMPDGRLGPIRRGDSPCVSS
jgi:Ser/Thr protein kinase RdoA (MazF antagonist)